MNYLNLDARYCLAQKSWYCRKCQKMCDIDLELLGNGIFTTFYSSICKTIFFSSIQKCSSLHIFWRHTGRIVNWPRSVRVGIKSTNHTLKKNINYQNKTKLLIISPLVCSQLQGNYERIIMLEKCGHLDLTVFHLIWVIGKYKQHCQFSPFGPIFEVNGLDW